MNIIDRIKKPIDERLCITPRTTPVPYFGNYETAHSCTISLNPSDREFQKKDGTPLSGGKIRLLSRNELGKADNEALTTEEAAKVLDYCNHYFSENPYKLWFDKYERFLEAFDLSYYNGSVVHLDIVQWATTPHWNKLTPETKDELLEEDLPFLKSMLSKDFEFMFLNGRTTVNQVTHILDIELKEQTVELIEGRSSTVFFGWYNGTRVIGWSPYLQSRTVGGYDKIRALADKVKAHNAADLIRK